MKLIILLGLFLVILNVKAEDDLNCHINELGEIAWNILGYTVEPPINDTHEGVVANFTTKNIKAIHVQPIARNIYLDATLEDNTLKIFTTAQFKDFEKDMKGLRDPRISIQIKCECADGKTSKTMAIHTDVTDINNHDPIFNKNRYEYHFEMTIPVGFDLTIFEPIRASDDDYLNDKIYFSIESDAINEMVQLKKNGQYEKGDYVTSLKALQNIKAPFKEEFNIIATDVGNPSASTKATVLIVVSLPEDGTSGGKSDHPPVFSKHLYIANYSSDNTLKMEEKMTIKYGAQDNMGVQQDGYEKYFKVIQNPSLKKELDVQIVEPLTEEILKEDYIIIDVVVKNEGSSYSGLTTLLVHLLNEENTNTDIHPPVFSKHLYIANYSSDNTLKMEEKMTIQYGAQENMAVQQYGYEKYFKITQNPSVKEELDVQIIEPLTEDILKEDYIIIDVEVKNEGSSYSGLTTLLIHLPDDENTSTAIHPPVFSKSVYFANYTTDHELKQEETITIKYGVTNNTFVKQSNYEEYIKIGLNPLNKTELQVEMIKPLDNQTLENDLIVIEITAENVGLSIPSRSNLIIQLQKEVNESSSCVGVVHIFGFTIGDTIFPLVLFLSAITIIVFVNIVALALYFKKNRANSFTTAS